MQHIRQYLNLEVAQPDLWQNCWLCMDLGHLRGSELQVLFHLNFYLQGGGGGVNLDACTSTENFSSCSSATQAAPDAAPAPETAPAPAPAHETGPVVVQAEVHRPQGEKDEGQCDYLPPFPG